MFVTRFPFVVCLFGLFAGTARAEYNRIAPPSATEQERVRMDLDPSRSGRAYREDNLDVLRQRETGEYRKTETAGEDSGKYRAEERIEGAQIIDLNEKLSLTEWARRNWKLLFAVAVIMVGGYVFVIRR